MSWSNVPNKNPGDPVTAENWNGLVGNFQALADAEPGAPRLLVPGALRTAETDATKVLTPDGAGGVRWGSVLGTLVGGQHLNLDGGTPVTTVPTDRLVWAIHGTVRNTAYHTIVVPAPSAALAGHLFAVNINQTGTYGGSRIRIGSTGGSYLAQWNDGDDFSALYACDGNHWFPVSVTHIQPDDD
jgi:hypothetical protein